MKMWFRILMVALGTFALGTDGLVIAGILPSIAQELSVSAAAAGQLETVFSLTFALGSPILVALLANITPKRLLVISMIVFIISNALAAIAPNFSSLMALRIVAACSVAIYTPVAATAIAMYAPPEKRGQALAFITAGLTVAIVVGVPMGVLISALVSWRGTFMFVAILGALSLIGILAWFPQVATPPAESLRSRLAVLGRPALLVMLCNTTVWMISGFVLYSYLGIVLQDITRLSGPVISLMFVWFGLTSIAGNILGGYGTDHWGAVRTLVIGIVGGGVALLAISFVAPFPFVMAAALAVWGISNWMLTPAQQTRMIAEAPEAVSIVLSLNGSAIYLGIGLGAAFGGLVIQFTSLSALGVAGSFWELVALGVLYLSVLLVRKRGVRPVLQEQPAVSPSLTNETVSR